MNIHDLVDRLSRFPHAYGWQSVKGWLVKHYDTVLAQNTQRTFQNALGEDPWDACESLWVDAFEIPPEDFTFHPGLGNDAPDAFFPTDVPHPWTSYIAGKATAGLNESQLEKVFGIYRTLRTPNYDGNGVLLNSLGNPAVGYSDPREVYFFKPNPANVAIHQIIRFGRQNEVIINFPAWVDYRDYNDEGIQTDDATYTPRALSLTPTGGGALVPGQTYYTRVSTIRGGDESSASLKTLETKANSITLIAGQTAFQVNWLIKGDEENPAMPPADISGYRVYIGTVNGVWLGYFNVANPAARTLLITTTAGTTPGAPLDIATAGLLVTIKRFECGLFFHPPYDLATSLDRICQISCADWQWSGLGTNTYRNDKIRFMSSANRAPVFTLNLAETGIGSFKTYPVDRRSRPNQIIVNFRDRADKYLAPAQPVILDREQLQSDEGFVRSFTIEAGTVYRSQAQRIASFYARVLCDMDTMASMIGSPKSYHVLPGDPVLVTNNTPDWTDVKFMVRRKEERTEGSQGDPFILQAYVDNLYSDTDYSPISNPLPVPAINPFSEPPVVSSVTLNQIDRILASGMPYTAIRGEVQFQDFNEKQIGRVFVRDPDDIEYRPAQIAPLVPDPVTMQDTFELPATEGTWDFVIVTESVFGKSKPFIDHPEFSEIVEGTVGDIGGTSALMLVDEDTPAQQLRLISRSNPPLTALRTLTFNVMDGSRTLKLGGNLSINADITFVNAFAATFNLTGITNVTFPTTGTLATLTGAESLSNKKLGSLTTNGPVYISGGDGSLNSELRLSLVRGGTGADLSVTGGSGQYVKQAGAGSALTVGIIADGDIPATIVRTSRQILAGVGLTGGGNLSADRTVLMGTPSTLSQGSSNSVSGTTHTHAITSSANPGGTQSLLASDGSGYLQLIRLGLGIAPTHPLTVGGDVFINAETARLYMKDTSTGWTTGSTTVINPMASNSIRSTSFTSGLIGWDISAGGDAEFANMTLRGALRTSILLYNAILTTAGTQWIVPSAGKLRTNVVVPAGPTYGTTTVTIEIVDQDGLSHAQSQLFAVNDILYMKDGLAGYGYFKVTVVSDQATFWRYTASIQCGTGNVTYRAGLGVADFKQANAGGIILTADQANAPYMQMFTHDGTFSALSSTGVLNLTPQMRVGNLNGSYGYATNLYGFGTGQYGTVDKAWLTIDPTNGLRIGKYLTTFLSLTSGGLSITDGMIALSGAGTYLGIGPTPPTTFGGGDGIWLGMDSGVAKLLIGELSDGAIITPQNVTNGSFAANVFTKTSGAVAGFSSVETIIGDGEITFVASETTTDKSVGLATSDPDLLLASINFAWRMYSVSSQLYIYELGVSAGQFGTYTASTALRIERVGTEIRYYKDDALVRTVTGVTTAPLLVDSIVVTTGGTVNPITLNDKTLVKGISWDGTNLNLAEVIMRLSGTTASISIGATPPTSATVGTGGWLDRNGLVGLLANVQQAKFDFTTGAITAGAGNIVLNANGIAINTTVGSESSLREVKWADSGESVGRLWTDFLSNTTTMTIDARGKPTVNGIANLKLRSLNDAFTGNEATLTLTSTSLNARATLTGSASFEGIKISNRSDGPSHFVFLQADHWTTFTANLMGNSLLLAAYPTFATAPALAGYGTSILFGLGVGATSTVYDAARIGTIWTNASLATRTSAIVFQTVNSAAALVEVARFTGPGNLELATTTGALLLNRLTTTQRDALTAANGMLIYNNTTNKAQIRAGGAWVDLH